MFDFWDWFPLQADPNDADVRGRIINVGVLIIDKKKKEKITSHCYSLGRYHIMLCLLDLDKSVILDIFIILLFSFECW